MNELMQSQAVRVRSASVYVNIPLSKNTKGLFFIEFMSHVWDKLALF